MNITLGPSRDHQDLVRIWNGDIDSPEKMSQLITIVARTRQWLCNTYRGEIVRLVSQALALAHDSVPFP